MPVDATMSEDDVPAQFEIFREINRVYFEDGHEAGEKMVAEFLAAKSSDRPSPDAARRPGCAPPAVTRPRR